MYTASGVPLVNLKSPWRYLRENASSDAWFSL
jgi:hypothetical protein